MESKMETAAREFFKAISERKDGMCTEERILTTIFGEFWYNERKHESAIVNAAIKLTDTAIEEKENMPDDVREEIGNIDRKFKPSTLFSVISDKFTEVLDSCKDGGSVLEAAECARDIIRWEIILQALRNEFYDTDVCGSYCAPAYIKNSSEIRKSGKRATLEWHDGADEVPPDGTPVLCIAYTFDSPDGVEAYAAYTVCVFDSEKDEWVIRGREESKVVVERWAYLPSRPDGLPDPLDLFKRFEDESKYPGWIKFCDEEESEDNNEQMD